MKLRSRGIAVVALVGVCAAFGTALAAPAAKDAGDVKAGSALGADEQVAHAKATVAKIETTSTTVRHMHDDARKKRDVVKVLCLQDKLSQLTSLGRTARERKGFLEGAAGRGDVDQRNHHHKLMRVLQQRGDQLGAEAQACIGEEVTLMGKGGAETTIDPNIAPDPNTGSDQPQVTPTPEPPIPPIPASGFH